MKSKKQVLTRIAELRGAVLDAVRSGLPAQALMAESRISELMWVLKDDIAREKACPHEAEAKLDHWGALLGAAPDATNDAPSEAVVRLSRGGEWS